MLKKIDGLKWIVKWIDVYFSKGFECSLNDGMTVKGDGTRLLKNKFLKMSSECR